VQAALKQWDEEISRLNGELTQLSVSHEDLRQSLEEQEATVLSLRQAAEDAREALEVEKKQVEGELLLAYVSERTLMSPRGGGVNRRDNQIKLFPPKHLS
jgi:DNA repair exonuclease SbcCD ATPase subunit